MPPKNDKKERLLKAAQSLIHRQGFHHTTLAAISEESGVSLGNMYYYFKTKEDILAAVTEGQTKRFHSYASDWEQDPLPRNRLLSFLNTPSLSLTALPTMAVRSAVSLKN